MSNKITHRVYDTFNRVVRSNHKTLRAAVTAASRFHRYVKRTNGSSSYIPTIIERLSEDDWIKVPIDEVHDAEYAAGIR
jgi:hypothetical protein